MPRDPQRWRLWVFQVESEMSSEEEFCHKQKERNWAEVGEGIGAQRWKSCRENKMHDTTKRKVLFE